MFVPVAARTVGELLIKKRLPANPTVVELGNQSYSVDGATLKDVIRELEAHKDAREYYGTDISALRDLSHKPAARRPKDKQAPYVSELFKAFGFSSYEAIDINTDLGSIVMDLNLDIAREYDFTRQYDLVTNIGVSEHLFAQEAFLKNTHAVTKSNGIMMHILPFMGWVNHGFFKYEPRLFYDLAAANGYELLELKLAERDRILMDLTKPNEILTYFYPYISALARNDEKSLFVIAVLKKLHESEFVFPLQGKYLDDIGEIKIERTYGSQPVVSAYPPPKGFFKRPAAADVAPSTRLRLRIKAALLRRTFKLADILLRRL